MEPDFRKGVVALKYLSWGLAGFALLWSLLPYVFAESTFVHTQTYAVVIVIVLFVMVRMVIMHLKAGTELIAPREETIALAGVSLASIAALLCCLLAPATIEITGSAGQTIALAEHAASLQFPIAAVAPADLGDMHVQLQIGAGRTLSIGSHVPLLVGDSMFFLHAKTVATIKVRGAGGDTLTITQPAGSAFLSPMLVFPKMTSIAELTLPSDEFAIPARDHMVRAFLVTSALMRDPRIAKMSNGTPGVLFSVDDAGGKPLDHGIGFAADGLPEQLADVVLTPKLGYFPNVNIASVPQPLAVLIGIVAYVFGAGTLAFRLRSNAT